MTNILRFVYYNNKINYVVLSNLKQVDVKMRKKDMMNLARELDVEFEIRKQR